MTRTWADLLPRTVDEASAFRTHVRLICKATGLQGFRTAPDCTACGDDLPPLKVQGIGLTEIYPGQRFGFLLCRDCGDKANTSDEVQREVIERLRDEYEQVMTTAGRAGEA